MSSTRKRQLSPISDSDLESEAKRHKMTSKVDFRGNQGAKLVSPMSGQAMEEPMDTAYNADTTCDAKSVGSTSQQVAKDIQIPDHILSQIRKKYITIKNAYREQCPCQLRNTQYHVELVEGRQYSSNQSTDEIGITGKSIRLSYSSLFKGDQGRKEGGNTRILIVGKAGIGKSILCASIAEDWANQELFQEFLMVFLLPLNQRGIASAQNLQELFKNLEFDGEVLASYLMANKKENILMIADGWDELSEFSSSKKSFLYRLLFDDFVPSSSLTVVVTSKSVPVVQQSISRFITVQGFSEETIKSYIQSEFSSNPEKSQLLERDPLLGSICSVPLNLSMICSYCKSNTVPLPSTMPELYKKLEYDNLLKLSNYRSLPNEVQQSWSHLCQLAFKQCQADFSKVIASGFLSTELETFGLLKPATDKVMFSFLYPAFKYYLAILHLTTLPPSEQLKVIKSMRHINPMFCRFYLSVSENPRSDIVSEVVQKLHHCCKDMCLLSFESKNEIVDREVAKSLHALGSTIMLHAQNAYECVAMVHMLEKIEQPCNVEINFQNCKLKEHCQQIPKLAGVLGDRAKMVNVKGLDLSDNSLSNAIIADFFSRASSAFGSLEKLFLRSCDIGEVGLQAIIDALANSSCESLTQLDLSFNSLSVVCLECFQQHIDKDKINVQNLEILVLKGSLAEDTSVNFLKSFATTLSTKCNHLRRLDLSGNKLDACNDPEFSKIVSQLTNNFGSKFDLRLDDMSKVEENFLTIMEESIKNKGTIDHTIAHGVIVGPGRSGKNTLLKRLTGEGPPDPNIVSPSTGVLENVVKVEVKKLCAVASDKCNLKWRKLKYDEEALELMMTTTKKYSHSSDVPRPVTIKYIYQKKSESMEDKKSPLSSKTKSSKQDTPKADKPQESESATSDNTDNVEEESTKHIAVYSSDLAPADVFKKAVKLRGMDALREHLESSWSLYLTNTGGQIEFQEYLPLLVCGPSIFFVTFPLHHDLDKPYKVCYEYPNGSVEEYLSPSTLMEEILQTLATIYTLDNVTVQIRDEEVTLKPIVFIIGTHRDYLKSETEKIAQTDGKSETDKIAQIDDEIQRYVKQTVLYDQDSIQFASMFDNSDEDRLIFTVNNLSKDDDDFQRIRFAVQQTVEKKRLLEFTVQCPSSWLIFSLILRENHKSTRVLRLENCFKIAQECGILNQEELKIALSFIHSRLGLVRYFKDDGLNSLVVVDPQILFDKITRLIVETFSGENAGHKEIEDFHKKGLISQPVVERISARSSEDNHDQLLLNTNHKKFEEFLKKGIISRAAMERISEGSSEDAQLPFTWLTKLLNHRRLAARFKDQYGELKYFFPPALCHVSKAQDTSAGSTPPNTPPKALIAFETGFCPRGIVGALIKCLMTNEMKSNQHWELLPRKIFRNQVSFRIEAMDGDITLKILPTHLEISLDLEEFFRIRQRRGNLSSDIADENLQTELHKTCEEAYKQIDKCMEDITTSLYRKCEYFWTFYCGLPECKIPRHPAVIEWDSLDKPKKLRCEISESLERTDPPKDYEMWNIQKKHKGGPGMMLLDAEVQDKQIGMIADSMSEWEGRIAEELELSRSNIACIKKMHKRLDLQIREALHIWKGRNGSDATYRNLIEVFERAECKEYAEEVRRIVQLSNSKTVHSSGEHSQPPAYPASDEPQSLSQVPPAMPMPTEVYEMREGTPPEEDGGAVCSEEVLDSQNVAISFVPKFSQSGSKGDQDHSDQLQQPKLDRDVPEDKQSSMSPAEDKSISDSAQDVSSVSVTTKSDPIQSSSTADSVTATVAMTKEEQKAAASTIIVKVADEQHERTSSGAVSTHSPKPQPKPKAPIQLVVDKPRLTFPFLDQVMEISEEEKERLKQRLYSESMDMKHKFQELFSATITSLKERKVTVKELLDYIGYVVAIEPVYEDSKLGQLQHELSKAQTIDDVMSIVREYSSFFNYEMLKNIIDHFGGEEDRKILATYLQEFAEYAKRRVYECPCEVGLISEAGRSNMFVVLDETYNSYIYTVNSLKNLERELAKILNVPTEMVVLCRITPGSLRLMFQIPLSVQKTIFQLSSEQEVALTKLGVTRLSCGEYYFANDSGETEDKGDHSSPEGDSDTEEQSTVAGTDLLSVVGGVDITGRGREKKGGSSSADSAIGTSRHSVVTGATVTGISQFSEDIMLRDLRDEPYLIMEARLRPAPDDSSGLELHQAAYNGELDSVKQLIEHKELNPLQVDKNGDNALHYTAGGGHLPVMKYLIDDLRLNPAYQGWKSRTPLHYAAWCKRLELVKYLIGEQQVDPLCQDEDGFTPLHWACVGGDIDVVQYLISEMKKYTSLDSIVYDRTKAGITAVHIAALKGHLPVIKLFISNWNFDLNTPGQFGASPLHSAAHGGHLDVIEYLIEQQHCDPLCRDSYLDTPIHWAAREGRLNVIKYFYARNCQMNVKNRKFETPLDQANAKHHINVVQYLQTSF